MKKSQLAVKLYCLALLASCQTPVPGLSNQDMKRTATLIHPEKTECTVIDNAQLPTPNPTTGRSVFYTLQFDINQDKIPDAEANVWADITHSTSAEIRNYISSIKKMSSTQSQPLKEWQRQIEQNPILKGKRTKSFVFWINDSKENSY